MRKIMSIALLALVTMVILCSCGGNQEKIQNDFLKMTGEKATAQSLVDVHDYMNQNFPKLDEDEAGHMLMAYEDYLIQYINVDADQTLPSVLEGYFDSEKKEIDEKKIQDPDTKKIYENLSVAGIRCTVQTGQFAMTVNYGQMVKEFGEYAAPAVSELYGIREMEFQTPTAENAVLKVSWAELADRAYQVETLVKKYRGEDMIRDDAQWMYENYLSILLMGMNNTPIFDFSSGAFSQQANQAYTQFIADHPDSDTAEVLKQYFSYLEDVDYTMNYSDKTESKQFFDQCSRLVSEAGKKVFE